MMTIIFILLVLVCLSALWRLSKRQQKVVYQTGYNFMVDTYHKEGIESAELLFNISCDDPVHTAFDSGIKDAYFHIKEKLHGK